MLGRTSEGEHQMENIKKENIRKNIIMRTSDEEYSKENIEKEYEENIRSIKIEEGY